ncbi:MAG TPA: NADH-quinone oxidoreductase subunit NuoH [Bacteroidota bacterium]|nr:NADH-quinone oxidoreductase subunit NuoH [Bacteroidota bacterium]
MDFLIIAFLKVVIVMLTVLTVVANLVYVERRISAFIQNRIGPNRVGPWGLLQSPADVIKLFIKEDIVPAQANRFIHTLAPIISISVALVTIAVVPFGDTIELFGQEIKLMIADVNIGILYILALTSLGVYGITLSGWSSNNKYSLLGGLRSSAQLISYELSMGLSIIGVVMIAGTLELDRIVESQAGGMWYFWRTPIGFITFVVASFAETNRLPFDLPEAEPELVGGYHTEYSGMKFGAFFLAEYSNMITSSALIVTLFLGGWHLPGVHLLGLSPLWVSLLQIGAFVAKVGAMLFFYMWIRWTIPRFRYDQLMNLGWKVMLPLSLLNLFVTGVLHFAFPTIW